MLIDAYVNLHQDCVSVRSRETEDYGTVVARESKVHVADAEFVVQPSGRRRARETGVRNVHAFVRGRWDDSRNVLCGTPITYDPFGVGEFVERETGRIVDGADLVAVTSDGAFAEGIEYRKD